MSLRTTASSRHRASLPGELGRERGSVTAEFAAIVPAVLLVLAFALGAIEVVVQQARLTDAAADGARSLARGDGEGLARSNISGAVGQSAVSVRTSGDFVCVSLAQKAAGPAALTGLMVHSQGCALGDDAADQQGVGR
ncbi:TadE family type IV pilus minor pilin [Humibacter ginsengisoli]